MRRRNVRTIREEERPTLLLMAAGAVAGAAAGLYLGHRYRSMDAFLADMRHRLADLRDIWYQADLDSDRRSRLGADVVGELDDEDDEALEEEESEDLDEDELEGAPFHSAASFDEEEDDDLAYDDDEFEDDLATLDRANGMSESSLRAEEAARRLEVRVLHELRGEPVLGSRGIEIAVVGDGVVELTGTVHSIEEVSRAAALVRGVPGVSMVLNRIEVRSGGSMDTASVARQPVEAPTDDPLAKSE